MKLRNGLKLSTYERYLTLLPEINQAIGYLRLREIRPMHLNNFYDQLMRPGGRKIKAKAVLVKELEPLLKERQLSRAKLAQQIGVGATTVTALCKHRPVYRETAEKAAQVLGKRYSDLFRSTKDESKPLSNKTVLEYHRLIGGVLAIAEKEMIVPYNAARKASPTKSRQKPANYFQPTQICDILAALESEPLMWQLLTHMLMITGARRGEVAGMKWSKFDFDRHAVKVDSALLQSGTIGVYESTTKTGNVRYIPLPQETIDLLNRYRIYQNELRLNMGDRWTESDFVFTREDGNPIRPDCITQWYADFSRRHDLPHINPHAFRHTAASVLISHGSDIVTVSKMLGHAKVSTTEDIYSHVIEESKHLASNLLAEVYFRGKVEKHDN
ncbi:MAG: tyrosine-type recombinase/integrase [Oscillospiraceae bacterium]|nr:tyrosine-type recombinase/integrase [Oscillospiraceae bacterium]